MKQFTLLIGLALFASALCFSCSSEDVLPQGEETETETETQKPDVYKPFEFSLTKTDTEIIGKGNFWGNGLLSYYANLFEMDFAISPFNYQTTLMMAANGASETGVQEIVKAMNMEGYSLDELNECYSKIVSGLNQGNDPAVDFKFGNFVWINHEYDIAPLFVENMKRLYNADVIACGYDYLLDYLKKWYSQFSGEISDNDPSLIRMLTGGHILMANACYYKGEWTKKFDPKKTKKGIFNNIDGTTSEVDMMMMNDVNVKCTGNDNYRLFRWDYGKEGDFYMMFYQTAESEAFLEGLKDIDWNQKLEEIRMDCLVIPRFKVHSEISAADYLKSLGVNEIFEELPKANKKMYLCSLNQLVDLSVDESGTEAAAVSGGGSFTGFDPHVIDLNTPFAYAIVEKKTGSVLFEGCVMNFNKKPENGNYTLTHPAED